MCCHAGLSQIGSYPYSPNLEEPLRNECFRWPLVISCKFDASLRRRATSAPSVWTSRSALWSRMPRPSSCRHLQAAEHANYFRAACPLGLARERAQRLICGILHDCMLDFRLDLSGALVHCHRLTASYKVVKPGTKHFFVL